MNDEKKDEVKKTDPQAKEPSRTDLNQKMPPQAGKPAEKDEKKKAPEQPAAEKHEKTIIGDSISDPLQKTFAPARDEAKKEKASSAPSKPSEKEDKTIMLAAEGTVIKDIIPGKMDAPEKKGTIVFMSGPDTGKKHDIMGNTGSETRIGRDEINDIVIKGEGVSRYHAKFIIEEKGKVKLVDLESRNGTFVNGKKVKELYLKGGEKINFGDVVTKFESGQGAASSMGEKMKQNPLLYGVAAAAVVIIVIGVLFKLSPGKDKKEEVAVVTQQQVVEVKQQVQPAKAEKPAASASSAEDEERWKQKLTAAERDFEIGNYDDAMQAANKVLEKNPSYQPALKLIKKINAKKQEDVDKEIIQMARQAFDTNSFDDAKGKFQQITIASIYYPEAQKYLTQINKLADADKAYQDAIQLWNQGNIDNALAKADSSISLLPVYKKPIALKEVMQSVKDLMAQLDTAERDGDISKTESLSNEIKKQVNNAENAVYKMAQGKIDKLNFGKYYKANKFYLTGVRDELEGRYYKALLNYNKARQLLPDKKSYDIRYKETQQRLSGKMMKIFVAAYILEDEDAQRSKNLYQKVLKFGIEDDPYYKKALQLFGE